MEKIKKVFSLILIMTFLCQNVAFCATGKSFTLRAPSHFSKPTEEFIKNQHERKDNTTPRLKIEIETFDKLPFIGNIVVANVRVGDQLYEISFFGVQKINANLATKVVEDPQECIRVANLVNEVDGRLGKAAIEEKWAWWTPQSGQELASNQRITEFSNGQIDIKNLGESEAVFPITSFSDTNTLFPVTDLEPGIMEFIKSLGIHDLSVALDDLVLNAIEHQFGSPEPVSMKIEKFKNWKILKITIQQPSSSKEARDGLDINKKGFDLRGPDYLIDVHERMKSSAFVRRGGAFRVIGDLIRFNSACLIYKIGIEEPFPIETNLYIFTERPSLNKLKQAIPSKTLQIGL